MAQHHSETPDRSNNNIEGMQAGEMVERRATSRILDDQSLPKFDLTVEGEIGAHVLKFAFCPERHPQGLPGFHMDSMARLEEQRKRVEAGCTPPELMAMMGNNGELMKAAQMRVELLMQTGKRASLVSVVEGDQLRFS